MLSGDGTIGIEEYRQDCVKRMAYSDIKQLDDAYNKLAGVIIQFYYISIVIFVYCILINLYLGILK